MSWLNNINTDLIILTGDGKEYKPQWINAVKSIEYNVSEFDFPEVSGTLVKRFKPRGAKYNLRIFFQGEDHLTESKDFELSANDSRAWTLTHPFFGRLTVQPTSLEFDNSKYNVTEIKGTIIETITDNYPSVSASPVDQIAVDVEETNEALAASTSSEVEAKGVKQQSITKEKTFLNKVNAANLTIINTFSETQDYYNAFNQAYAGLDSIASTAETSIRLTQSVISAPASFQTDVKSRMGVLSDNFESLNDSLVNVLLMDKYLYQSNGGALMSAMCTALSTPLDNDYGSREDVLSVMDGLLSAYDLYLTNLDSLQTDTGGTPESFIPSADPLQQLNQLVNYTVSNLFNIASEARQQRSFVLEKDSNWISLSHRLYGLKANDSTIDELIRNNNAGLSEMLKVLKNRVVVYYV